MSQLTPEALKHVEVDHNDGMAPPSRFVRFNSIAVQLLEGGVRVTFNLDGEAMTEFHAPLQDIGASVIINNVEGRLPVAVY